MSTIVAIGWQCLTLCTEIDIVTNSTFISIPSNESLDIFAQWAITVDVVMDGATIAGKRDRLIERDESVTWMARPGGLDAG